MPRSMKVALRSLTVCALCLAQAPGIALAQGVAYLDMFLPRTDAMLTATWLGTSPARFSWWDPIDGSPSAVTCNYNISTNWLQCAAPAGGEFAFTANSRVEGGAIEWLTNAAVQGAPLWPNTTPGPLGFGQAYARFDGNGALQYFQQVELTETLSPAGAQVMHYRFVLPIVTPEPTSMVLLASGLVGVGWLTRRRRGTTST